eukprot:scpid66977/ scgid13907/ 
MEPARRVIGFRPGCLFKLAATTMLATVLLSRGVVQRPLGGNKPPAVFHPTLLNRASISRRSMEQHSKASPQNRSAAREYSSRFRRPRHDEISNEEAVWAHDRSEQVAGAGERWYRYGTPFHTTPLGDVSLVFKAADLKGTSLLLYGQLLQGIFHPAYEQYIAVLLNDSVVIVTVKRNHATPAGESKTQTASTDQKIEANVWYRLCVVTSPVLQVYSEKASPDSIHLTEDQLSKCGQSESSPEKALKPVLVDSGLYFGGVIDWQACPGLTTLRNLQTFRGKILRKVHVNMQEVDLTNCTTGYAAETWRVRMSKIDIKHPISIRRWPVVKPQVDLSFQHFPVVSALSNDHAVESEDMIASVAKHMPLRGVIIYDLGMSQTARKSTSSYCNVTIRSFRQDIFKDFTSNLKNYRWKPLLVYGAFLEFDGVIWADASIRFQHPIRNIPLVQNSSGFVGFEMENASPIA